MTPARMGQARRVGAAGSSQDVIRSIGIPAVAAPEVFLKIGSGAERDGNPSGGRQFENGPRAPRR